MIGFKTATHNFNITITSPTGSTVSGVNVTAYSFTPLVSGVHIIHIEINVYSITYNVYLEPNSYTLTPFILLDTIYDRPLGCDFGVIYHPCKNYVSILYSTLIKPKQNFYFYYNNEWVKTNSITTEIKNDKVEVGIKLCDTQLVEVNDCCGGFHYEYQDINCEELTCIIDVEPTNFSYITSFIDCASNELTSVEKSLINNICNGYCSGGCDCNEIKNCKCIPINYPIVFTVEGFIQSNNCGSSNNLFELIVDGTLEDSYTVSNINEIEPFQLTFTQLGLHKVELHLTDCCGNKCINKHEIIVGGDVFINTSNCPHTFTLYNYLNTSNNNKYINIFDLESIINSKTEDLSSVKPLVTYELYNQIENHFTLNGVQGLFVLEYKEVDKNTNQVIYKRYFIIYDVCKLYECYLEKVKKSLEGDCKECNDKIMDLSLCEFQMMFDTLKTQLDIILKRSSGYYNAAHIRFEDVINAEYLINKLKFICDIDLDNKNISKCCDK